VQAREKKVKNTRIRDGSPISFFPRWESGGSSAVCFEMSFNKKGKAGKVAELGKTQE
jgi:hypothetical protein